MTNKKCLVFETMNNVNATMQIVESSNPKELRLTGVFGVAGVKNNNNRIYDKQNYGMMVESLQKVIATEGCLGELEHPSSMNINLNNVSHKIESIEMNEDGTVTGTIVLLDTDKGRNAKAIIESGVPLFISSRAAGSIDESGHVTLTSLKTYDLVGTPGFSQAKLNLSENQTFECLNESMCIVYESEDEEDPKDNKDNIDDEGKTKEEEGKKESEENDDDNNKNNENKEATMAELKEMLEKLTKQVEDLQADLHVAKECKETVDNFGKRLDEFQAPEVDYTKVQEWVTDVYSKEFKENLLKEIDNKINESIEFATEDINENLHTWVLNDFSPILEKYMTTEFAPTIQQWVNEEYSDMVEQYLKEEFAPDMESWVINEYSPIIESYLTEEYSPTVENWINEELVPTIDTWINEECIKEHKESILTEVNTNINQFMEAKKEASLTNIDNLLEAIEGKNNKEVDEALALLHQSQVDEKYKGEYVVEHMPEQYLPQWQMIDEAKQQEIIKRSRMYDFNKAGVLESFWATIDFEAKPITESQQVAPEHTYHNNIFSMMKKLRK